MKYIVVASKFHASTVESTHGYFISQHNSFAAAEKALAKYNKQHKQECQCGSGQILLPKS